MKQARGKGVRGGKMKAYLTVKRKWLKKTIESSCKKGLFMLFVVFVKAIFQPFV